jgi:hypothetical protein
MGGLRSVDGDLPVLCHPVAWTDSGYFAAAKQFIELGSTDDSN